MRVKVAQYLKGYDKKKSVHSPLFDSQCTLTFCLSDVSSALILPILFFFFNHAAVLIGRVTSLPCLLLRPFARPPSVCSVHVYCLNLKMKGRRKKLNWCKLCARVSAAPIFNPKIKIMVTRRQKTSRKCRISCVNSKQFIANAHDIRDKLDQAVSTKPYNKSVLLIEIQNKYALSAVGLCE